MEKLKKCRYQQDRGKESIVFDRRHKIIIDVNTHIIQFANKHFFETLETLQLQYSIDLSNRTNARLYKNSIIQVFVALLHNFKFDSPNPYFFVCTKDLGDQQHKLLKSCFSLLGVNFIEHHDDINTMYHKIEHRDVTTNTFIDLAISNVDLDTSSSIKNIKRRAKTQGLNHVHDELFEEGNNKIIFN